MLSFRLWLREEVLRNIDLSKAIARSGIAPHVLNHAKGVMSINQFIETPPPNIDGGYALGLTTNMKGIGDIYWHLAEIHKLNNWEDAYQHVFGSTYRQKFKDPTITHQFLSSLTKNNKDIVFFVPSSMNDLGRYTREELEYFTKYPDKANNVYFIFGTYDIVSPEDYLTHLKKDDPQHMYDLTQSVLSEPQKHRKPETY